MSTVLAPPQSPGASQTPNLSFLEGGGELGKLIRTFDWSKTPLGEIGQWPQSLKTSISLMLNSRHPMWIGWRPENTFLYNDAYVSVLGQAKHPWALGRPASEVWAEIWDICGPLADKVFLRGEATFVDDVRLFMRRGPNFLEETFYSFSYSPIRDESGGVGGLFCPSSDVTAKNIGTRRLATLSDLSAKALLEKTTERACVAGAAILAKNLDDVPFALVYLVDGKGQNAVLLGRSRLDGDSLLAPGLINLDAGEREIFWPIRKVIQTGELDEIPLGDDVRLPFPGAADQPITSAVVVPVKAGNEERPSGVLIAGVNPTRKLDPEYRAFYTLIASQIGTAVTNARISEEQQQRAEALAELDRAKTTFFSNVSHELRTPLTLMLGPLEDLLNAPTVADSPEKPLVQVAYRNGLRLLKLVNTLLEFTRIEAGRVQAAYQPTDLAAFTAELASVFRAAVEKAGMKLIVDCPPLKEPVYVDREMWEKIVLNLLSNALKFTFEGEIKVSLHSQGEYVELRVQDSGVGIPEQELPRLFERFHRVRGSRSRSHEGTGIGLALVQELARLHGGDVKVESREGRGTTFTVTIRNGAGHLPREKLQPADEIAGPTGSARAFIEEAGRWLPGEVTVSLPARSSKTRSNGEQRRILLADDNADMRAYLSRLLEAEGLKVTSVADGAAALRHVSEEAPNLVLTDVMMPRMNGFELLANIRADARTKSIPVIMLSARAGEEARVEGLNAGADDYLIKPFSARELLARVSSQLALSQLRREGEERLEKLVAERTAKLQEIISELEAFSYTISHDLRSPLRAMQGYAEELLESASHQLSETHRNYLDRIHRAAARLDILTQEVLTYSRISRAEVALRPVDTGKLVREVIEQYPNLREANASIHVGSEWHWVLGNDAYLTQALSNLLSNALKFRAPERKPEIQVGSTIVEGKVRIYVADNGIGIEPRHQDRIFQMFGRIHPEKQYPGTGVGLAIMRKSVEKMNGQVGFESTPGKGSRFWLDVPRAEPPCHRH